MATRQSIKLGICNVYTDWGRGLYKISPKKCVYSDYSPPSCCVAGAQIRSQHHILHTACHCRCCPWTWPRQWTRMAITIMQQTINGIKGWWENISRCKCHGRAMISNLTITRLHWVGICMIIYRMLMGDIKCHKEMNIAFWHVVSSKDFTIFLGTNDSSCGSRIISASKHGKCKCWGRRISPLRATIEAS